MVTVPSPWPAVGAESYAERIARIDWLATLLDTEVLVIGGGLAAAGSLLLDPTREAFAAQLLGGRHRLPVRVVLAELGPEAGAIGAAMVAPEPPPCCTITLIA